MADARSKKVLPILQDLWSESRYGADIAATQMREPLGMSDIIDIPDISALTVNASGSVTANPAAVTTNVMSLTANLEPWINALLPQLASMQLLDGRWAQQVGRQAVTMLKNDIDESFFKYLLEQAWQTGTDTAYHVNEAADTLTSADILNAMAALTDNKGVNDEDLCLFMSSYGRASLASIAAFVPNNREAERGNLGVPLIGTIHGIPVYASSSVPRARTITSTAWDISSNVLTITVASGHGLAAGQLVTFDTVTAGGDMSSATAITSTTATVITIAHTASDDSATEAGTITCEDSENLMIAKNHTFVAQQMLPKTRIVPMNDSTGDALQVSAVWGRVARAGYAQVIHSPKSSI
tara:strand:+ start:4791 stop:5852 length:1062 start_codon:yes stop_codon:yes gene_type:complete